MFQPSRPDWHDEASFWFHPDELPRRPARLDHGVHGNGRLANERDLADLLAPAEPGDLVLPGVTLLVEKKANGAELVPLVQRKLRFPTPLRERHLLAVGTTGSGKTQRLILPQLAADMADPRRCLIALDAKGGILHGYLTALARRLRPGQPVHLINLRDPARNTLAWNPVQRIASRAEALEIAHSVCANVETAAGGSGHQANEAFWLFSSVNLLADVLRLLADNPAEQGSLARAKQVVDSDTVGLAHLADNHPHTKDFARRYPAVVRVLEGNSHVTQQSILADLAMRLLLFGDEEIAHTTSGPNQLDMRAIVRAGGILVLEVPEIHARQLTPLTNLFVTRLFSALLEEAGHSPDGRLPRPCSVVLDELGSACGKLPEFDIRLSTLRSRGVAVTGAVQTLTQLQHLYGSAAGGVLDGFCTRLFFGGGLGQADARYASELAGNCTVGSIAVTKSLTASGDVSRTRTLIPIARPVLVPEEIARPGAHPLLGSPVTVFTPERPPFWAYLPAAYEGGLTSACLQEGVALEARWRQAVDTTTRQTEVARLKGLLGWNQLGGAARAWWHAQEKDAETLLAFLREFAEEHLGSMETAGGAASLLQEMYQASRQCEVEEPQVLLAFFRYWLLEQASRRTREGSPSEGKNLA
jgi:Type IV secretory system Conjugative DNA transfer